MCLDAPADSAPGGPLAGFELTGANAGADDALDSDAALVNGAPCITPAATGAAGSFVPTYDFGFWKPAAIGDRVWVDGNHNGIQDAGEPGVGGVGVVLKDAAGATIARTATDASGLYLFDRLPAGDVPDLLRGRHDPVRLRHHDEGRERRDARQRLRRGGRRLRRHHASSHRASATSTGTRASGRRRLRRPAPVGRLHAAPSPGKPKLSLTKGGKPGTVRGRRHRALHARGQEHRQGAARTTCASATRFRPA